MGVTDKDPLTYRPNETMTFTLSPQGGDAVRWTRTGDDGKEENGEAKADAPVTVKTSLDRPGFVRLVAELRCSGVVVETKEIKARDPDPMA